MKRFFPGTLVITGGALVIAPLIYRYLVYRLIAQVLIERADSDKIKFGSSLPEYYIPVCLAIGLICIGVGIVFEIKDRKINTPF